MAFIDAERVVIADFSLNTFFTLDLATGAVAVRVADPAIGNNIVGLAIATAGNFIAPINFEVAVKKLTFGVEGALALS